MGFKEIVFISGKGGTGKTTVTSSLIPYFTDSVLCDLDVDAPDLYILLNPEVQNTLDFLGTSKAIIDSEKCTNCGICINYCKFEAIANTNSKVTIKAQWCEGCNVCNLVCPNDAVSLKPYKTGEIYTSITKYGEMIHGRLTPGEEVSGRLVSRVRNIAKERAKEGNKNFLIIDGPPGIACNLISAITGTDLAVIIVEPTASGYHDFIRVNETANKLGVKNAVIINKFDLSMDYTNKVKKFAGEYNIPVIGQIPLSKEILNSIKRKAIPEIGGRDLVESIRNLV